MEFEIATIKSFLKEIPDFPVPGILFQDIFPIFKDPKAVELVINHFLNHINTTYSQKIDVVVGLDARGFLLGPLLALKLNCAFAPVRKQGKLPGKCVKVGYTKEYGTDYFEMQEDAFEKNAVVVVVDDLLATGGSAKAAQELILALGGNVIANLFIIELVALNGSKQLNAPTYSIVKIQD